MRIRTRSGWYDLVNPDPKSIVLGDVAHALARINRFTGHTEVPYSVAQHSVLGARILRDRGAPLGHQRAFLMHDAHESMIGDVSSPVAQCVLEWRDFEQTHFRAFASRFGTPRWLPTELTRLDRDMAFNELHWLLGEPLGVEKFPRIIPWGFARAESEFLEECARLEVY